VDGKPNATLTDTWGMREEPRRAREGAVEDDRRARVVLADDDVLLREGLASLLERSGFEVVGQAGDASQLLTLVREQEPDIAIIDIRMPPDYGIEGSMLRASSGRNSRSRRSSCSRRTSRWITPWSCSPVATGWATCSRVASPMSATSSSPSIASLAAARWSTPASCTSWWLPAAGTTLSRRSRPVSGKCSP
jgi:CheY-like chemotaxis protein